MTKHALHWLRGLLIVLIALPIFAVGGLLVWNVLRPPPAYVPIESEAHYQYWELADGSRLAYQHTAPAAATAPPVILVHGGPGAPTKWPDVLIDALTSAGHDVYDYHQIGAGLSSRLSDRAAYTVGRHISDLEAVQTAIRAERVVLLGTSWGAQLIATYLAKNPHSASHAIFVSPGTIWAPAYTEATRLTESGQASQGAVVARFPRIPVAVILNRTIGPTLAGIVLPDSIMDATYQAFVEALDMRAGCPGSPDTFEQPLRGYGYWVNAVTTADASRVEDPRPILRQIDVPVLIVRGSCDYMAPAVAGEYAELFSSAEMAAIANAGHVLAAERPEELAHLVQTFLAR